MVSLSFVCYIRGLEANDSGKKVSRKDAKAQKGRIKSYEDLDN